LSEFNSNYLVEFLIVCTQYAVMFVSSLSEIIY